MTHAFGVRNSSKSGWKYGLVLFLALSASASAEAKTIIGLVVGVTDGDTLIVLDESKSQHKVRLAGIDAPEKRQAFGLQSKLSLSELAYGKEVAVETSKLDKYGRQIGKVLVDGQDLNLAQLQRGMAWFYRKYQQELMPSDRRRYEEAEHNSKSLKIGLWAELDATPPWNYRKGAVVHTKVEMVTVSSLGGFCINSAQKMSLV